MSSLMKTQQNAYINFVSLLFDIKKKGRSKIIMHFIFVYLKVNFGSAGTFKGEFLRIDIIISYIK